MRCEAILIGRGVSVNPSGWRASVRTLPSMISSVCGRVVDRRFFLLTVFAKQRYSSANISATYKLALHVALFFSAFMKALFSLQKRLLVRAQSDV